MRKYICQTPKDKCSGANCMITSGMGGYSKLHSDSEEAFKCYKRYLLSLGYKQVGSKEFQLGDGPVEVLTRPGKYGATMRKGKNVEGKGKRFCPKRNKSNVSGVII